MDDVRAFVKIKVQKEYDDFVERLSKRSVYEVVSEAYTIVIKSEILSLLLNDGLENKVLEKLKDLDNIIDIIYYAWLKADLTNNDDLKLVIYKYTGYELES